MSVLFIIGPGRSGTTSLSKAFALSDEVLSLSEPPPNLNHESRDMYEGRLSNPSASLVQHVGPRISAALDAGKIYVEKQLSLVPFIGHLHQLFRCRFIIPVRDGRDVVSSMLNWHAQMFPIIYSECKEQPELSPRALDVLRRQKRQDPFDYSLPRPPANDPWHDAWPEFTRFEMIAWYWAFVNRYIARQLATIPREDYLILDYTDPDESVLWKAYDFAGVSEHPSGLADHLASRVNSLEDRVGESGRFPRWRSWSPPLLQRFFDLAGDEMGRLGFLESARPTFDPSRRRSGIDSATHASAFDPRRQAHDSFEKWVQAFAGGVLREGGAMDLGCGSGRFLADRFAGSPFIGVDPSPAAIAWSRAQDRDPKHRYVEANPLTDVLPARAQLVFSHASVDEIHDVDTFVRVHARQSDDAVYIASHRGWFGSMYPHRRRWDEASGARLNDLSAARCEEVLEEEGYTSVLAFPGATGREDTPAETVVIASRRSCSWAELSVGHTIHFDFVPYLAETITHPAEPLLDLVDGNCSGYSGGEQALANRLEDFAMVLRDVAATRGRVGGSLADFTRRARGINTAYRIDVDMDLRAALGMAAIAGRASVPVTFFALHTAYYYGRFGSGGFQRYSGVAECLRRIQSLGAEVGLHVDALGVYLQHGMDGAEAIVREIDWLRAGGIDIRGTTGHNAAAVYGAENFEIFAGRDIRRAGFGRKAYRYYPLGVLSEAALGLDYEGSLGAPAAAEGAGSRCDAYLADHPRGNIVRNRRWFRQYLHDNPYSTWASDFNVWVLGKDFWAVSGRRGREDEVFRFGVGWQEVRILIASLAPTERVLFTLHPIYFGHRSDAGRPPDGFSSLIG